MRNPRLGNHGLEFKQRSALGALHDALVEEKGRSVPWDDVESLAEASFQRILIVWQREQAKIFPVRDYPTLRVQATVALAQFVASGGMRRTNPRRTTKSKRRTHSRHR